MTVVLGGTPRPQAEAALERALAEAQVRGDDVLVVNASSGSTAQEILMGADCPVLCVPAAEDRRPRWRAH